MKGFNIAEQGHVVNIIPPVDINGSGASSDVFSLENYRKAQIILTLGTTGAASTVTVKECDDFTPSNSDAIAFNVYKEETGSGDTLGERTAVESTGFATSTEDDITYVIDIDVSELSDGYPCLQVVMTDPEAATVVSAVAVLSGARYAEEESPTVIA